MYSKSYGDIFLEYWFSLSANVCTVGKLPERLEKGSLYRAGPANQQQT